jgi:hypothetical protein
MNGWRASKAAPRAMNGSSSRRSWLKAGGLLARLGKGLMMSEDSVNLKEQSIFLLAASVYLAVSPFLTVIVARDLFGLQLTGMQFALPPLVFGLVITALYLIFVRANAVSAGRNVLFDRSQQKPSAIYWVPPLAGGIAGIVWRYLTLEFGLLPRPDAIASSYFAFGSISCLAGSLIIKGLRNASR